MSPTRRCPTPKKDCKLSSPWPWQVSARFHGGPLYSRCSVLCVEALREEKTASNMWKQDSQLSTRCSRELQLVARPRHLVKNGFATLSAPLSRAVRRLYGLQAGRDGVKAVRVALCVEVLSVARPE